MNVCVVEADDGVAMLIEPFGAGRIVFGLVGCGVGVTVYFDDEFGRGAVEVGDEAIYNVLAAEFVAKLPVAAAIPDFALGGGERVAQVAGALEDGRVEALGGRHGGVGWELLKGWRG